MIFPKQKWKQYKVMKCHLKNVLNNIPLKLYKGFHKPTKYPIILSLKSKDLHKMKYSSKRIR